MRLTYPAEPLVAGASHLRPWRANDLDCVAAAADDPKIPLGTTVPSPFTVAEGAAFLHRQQQRLSEGTGISQAIADAVTDEALGLVYLGRRPQPWIAGLGYWLVPAARGQHRATEAVRAVSGWALAELDIRRLEAWVDPDNTVSQRVLEHSGFALEGLLRNFLWLGPRPTDALVYSRVS